MTQLSKKKTRGFPNMKENGFPWQVLQTRPEITIITYKSLSHKNPSKMEQWKKVEKNQ